MNNNYFYLYIVLLLCIISIVYTYWDLRKSTNKITHNLFIDQEIDLIMQCVKTMNGRQFEVFCGHLFALQGYNVEVTQPTNDEGKDIILNKEIYVECKCWDENNTDVGRPILQKLIGAMMADNIAEGIVISTTDYNSNALDYLNKLNKNTDINLTLYTLGDIRNMIKNIGSEKAYRIVNDGLIV